MLSAAVRRTSRDVSIMKEKLIFSGDTLHGPWIRWFTCNTEGQVDITSFQAHTHARTEGQKQMYLHVRQPQIQGLSDRLGWGICLKVLHFFLVTSISDSRALSPAASPCCCSQSDEGSCKDMCKTGCHCTSCAKSQGRKRACPELCGEGLGW